MKGKNYAENKTNIPLEEENKITEKNENLDFFLIVNYLFIFFL